MLHSIWARGVRVIWMMHPSALLRRPASTSNTHRVNFRKLSSSKRHAFFFHFFFSCFLKSSPFTCSLDRWERFWNVLWPVKFKHDNFKPLSHCQLLISNLLNIKILWLNYILDYGCTDGWFSLSTCLVTILNFICLFSWAVYFWVKLKAWNSCAIVKYILKAFISH